MKTKFFTLLSLSVLTLIVFMGVCSADVLAEWDFDDFDLIVDSGTGTLTINNAGTASYVAGNPSTGNALSTDDWDAAEYFEIIIDLTGYQDINLFFDEEASPTGPTQFKIQYSSDGTTFTDLSGSTTSTTPTLTGFGTTPMHTFDLSGITTINNNANAKLRITDPNGGSNSLGVFHIDNLKIEGLTYTEEPENFCNSGLGALDDDDLTLNVEINNRGEGEDEDWLPLDRIQVTVELENDKDLDGDGDLDDVVFELGLYKEDSDKNIISEMMWISEDEEEFELGDIDEDEDGEHVFEFKINPEEVDEGDYILVVKAYPDGKQDETCIDYSDDLADSDFGTSEYYADIKISKEDDDNRMVVVDELDKITASCGQEVIINADVYNIGDKDYLEQIMVNLIIDELGINLEEVIEGDFDKGDSDTVRFTLTIPDDAEEGLYNLKFRTFYDYDEDDEEYDEASEILLFSSLKIEGNCICEPKVTVSADLESEARSGRDLVIRATIVNTGEETSTFEVSLANYINWAVLESVVPESITLDAGESEEVLITLDVNSDVSGNQNFEIVVTEGTNVLLKEVQVDIEQGGFAGLGRITGGLISEANWPIWTIGAVNVILVFIIILVALKISKK